MALPTPFSTTTTTADTDTAANQSAEIQVQPTEKIGSVNLAPVNSNELLSNNVNNVISQDSALMQRAKSQSNQQMSERGLKNSTLALTAAENAVYDNAIQIAAGDTQAYQNQANQQREYAASDLLQSSNQLFQSGENELDRTQQTTLQDDQQTFVTGENALDRTQQTTLQDDQQTFVTGENALDRAFSATQQDDQQAFIKAESELDRSLQTVLQDDQQTFMTDIEKLRHENSLGALSKEQEYLLTRMEKELANNQALQDDSQMFNATQSQLARLHDAGMLNDQQLHDMEMFAADLTKQKALIATELGAKQAMAYQQNLAEASDQYMKQSAAIMANPDLTADQVENALTQLQTMFKDNVAILDDIYAPGDDAINWNDLEQVGIHDFDFEFDDIEIDYAGSTGVGEIDIDDTGGMSDLEVFEDWNSDWSEDLEDTMAGLEIDPDDLIDVDVSEIDPIIDPKGYNSITIP